MSDQNELNLSFSLEEKILKRIPAEVLLLSLLLSILSFLLFDPFASVFVLAGGVFSAASFVWLRKSMSRLLTLEKKKAMRSGILLYSFRLLLILSVFSIIILFFSTRIIFVVGGFSTIVPVLLVEGIIGLSRIKKWKN